MILVDTSVWVEHLRSVDIDLARLLNGVQVLAHPFVNGELALGNFKQRTQILKTMQALPHACMASDQEVLQMIEQNALHGSGIGYIDAHWLAAVCLTGNTTLWTRDKRLRGACEKLNLVALSLQ